ncbi:hypothetical protein [Tritonibacter horizontis]|uniref:hypothetical protein n=1 Tax=Tritonibacter horizontis TaxID=1768241 RepID=UPI0013F4F6EA|nr:hypothetical protein [Tritonibacter horizontis]
MTIAQECNNRDSGLFAREPIRLDAARDRADLRCKCRNKAHLGASWLGFVALPAGRTT